MNLKHITSARQFDKVSLKQIFTLTDNIKSGDFDKNALSGKIMATLFYEPSTRTRLSFESAILKLGGSFISTENAKEFSSAAKGETLEDTIRIVNSYADLIVLRHFESGASDKAAKISSKSIINAGDGNGEHPTQALLDLYTIQTTLKREHYTIAMAGDLSNYRSVHSLSYLLSQYPKVDIIYVSPKTLAIPDQFRNYLTKNGMVFSETDNFDDAISRADIIYQTRIPKEYLSKQDFKKYSGKYVLDKNKLKLIKKDAFIMHPLPRVNEITQEVDSDSRAIYFEQAENGVYVRMALLLLLFGP